jgi:antirestriction protein ArdC
MTTSRTRKPRRSSPDKPRPDAYQVITDQIIALLDAGTVPWHKPWNSGAGDGVPLPLSMSSRKPYRGINVWLLAISAMTHGYSSPWWGTYQQISDRGGQVRKGEKSTQVVLWKPIEVDDETKPGAKRKAFLLRTFNVFNADQADGLDDLKVQPEPADEEDEERAEVERIEACEAALAAYYLTGPSLAFGGNAAYYVPSADHVQMPPRESFESSEALYGTWFHETVHSTGHKSRLARKDLLESHSFGDRSYSREELVAEMGAAFLSGLTGIAAETLPQSASYLEHWISVLKGDKKLLVSAAAQAQKAVDLILGDAAPVATEEESEPAAETVTV